MPPSVLRAGSSVTSWPSCRQKRSGVQRGWEPVCLQPLPRRPAAGGGLAHTCLRRPLVAPTGMAGPCPRELAQEGVLWGTLAPLPTTHVWRGVRAVLGPLPATLGAD